MSRTDTKLVAPLADRRPSRSHRTYRVGTYLPHANRRAADTAKRMKGSCLMKSLYVNAKDDGLSEMQQLNLGLCINDIVIGLRTEIAELAKDMGKDVKAAMMADTKLSLEETAKAITKAEKAIHKKLSGLEAIAFHLGNQVELLTPAQAQNETAAPAPAKRRGRKPKAKPE